MTFRTLYSAAFVKAVRSEDGDFYYMPVKAKVDTVDGNVGDKPLHTVMINNTPFHWGFEDVAEAHRIVRRYNEGPRSDGPARWCGDRGAWLEED